MRFIIVLSLVLITLINIEFVESFFYNNNLGIRYNFYARDMKDGMKRITIKNLTE